jgi:hypothetical protein
LSVFCTFIDTVKKDRYSVKTYAFYVMKKETFVLDRGSLLLTLLYVNHTTHIPAYLYYPRVCWRDDHSILLLVLIAIGMTVISL